MAEHVSDHRALFHLRKGGLHQWARHHGFTGSDSDPLPEKYKTMAAASDNEHVRKMGQFAKNFGGK
jgi:hypothetical protein